MKMENDLLLRLRELLEAERAGVFTARGLISADRPKPEPGLG